MNATTYTVNAFEFDDLDKDARATALAFMSAELESDEHGQFVAITQEIEDGAAGELWRSHGIEPHVSGFVWSLFGQGSGAGPDGLPIDDARPLLRAAGIDLRTQAARRVIELAEAGRLSTRTNGRTPFLTELAVRTDWEDEGGIAAEVFDRVSGVLRDLNDRTERLISDAVLWFTGEEHAIDLAREQGAAFAPSGDPLPVELMEVKS